MDNRFDPRALDTEEAWPRLGYEEWRPTLDTVHRWVQIVGKVKLNLAPPINHFWHCGLSVSERGLATGAIPYADQLFGAEFDFLQHNLHLRTSRGGHKVLPLLSRSVAGFYREFMAALQALGVQVWIHPQPDEVEDRTPFPEDTHHATYDPAAMTRCWRAMMTADTLLSGFRSRYQGKASPVIFYWGSFDLALSFDSERRAPERPEADPVTREAYSHEVANFGWWPGSGEVQEAAFYAYAAPEPAGFRDFPMQPAGVRYSEQFSNFIYPWEEARRARSPASAVLTFFGSAWEAACTLGGFSNERVEREEEPLHDHRPAERGAP